MIERRHKRSSERAEALQYLVESVADRSGVAALVLVDDGGKLVAGMGMPEEVAGLAKAARQVAWGRASADYVDATTRGRDVTARGIATRDGMIYFAALTDTMSGLGDATRALHRILG